MSTFNSFIIYSTNIHLYLLFVGIREILGEYLVNLHVTSRIPWAVVVWA